MILRRLKKILGTIPTAVVMAFIMLPVVLVVWMSFFDQKIITFPPKEYTIEWYTVLAEKSTFADAALLSLEVALISSVLAIVLGCLACIGLKQKFFRGKNLMETMFLAPLTVPTIVSGIAIYAFLTVMGNSIGMKLVPNTWVLILGHTVITIPWAVRLISAGLAGVNPALEEAALSLGANRVYTYVKIIFPQIRSSLVTASIFSFIVSLTNLEMSLMLIKPGQTTLPIETLNYVLWEMDPSIAALTTVQIMLIFMLLVIANKLIGLSKVF